MHEDANYIKQVMEELNIERRNQKAQFQFSPVAMVRVDENAIVQDVNDRFIDVFGDSNIPIVGEELGKSLGCTGTFDSACGGIVECGICPVKEYVPKVIESRLAFRDVEMRFQLLQNGKRIIRDLRFNFVPIYILDKTNVLISIDDMTEYRAMEENLRHSRDSYQALFDEFPSKIWRLNKEMRIDYANERLLRFAGVETYQELDEILFDLVHPEDANLFSRIFDNTLDKKEPVRFELRIKSFDGEYRWFANYIAPYHDLENNFAGYIGAFFDITEQKQARDILKKYELISEKVKDVILVMDIDGRIIEANEAAIRTYGYDRKELLTKTIYDIRRDEDVVRAQMENATEQGDIYEVTHYRKDGSSLPVEISIQSTMFDEKKVIVSIIRDITERKQVEVEMHRAMEATKAAYRAKSEFLANMSHEIRTPLNGVIGMVDLTMLTDLTHDQLDNLITAKTCANSLLKIINDVLDFSKMEAGKLTIDNVEFSLKVLIEKIVKVHYYRAKEKRIDLTYQLPINLPSFLIGDPNRLQQVLNNLLSNAVKFTDKGCISLTIKVINCTNDLAKLQFSIADTGIGISNDEMNKLFKSFSQIDGSQTRRHGGTGLGLVISRQLIEMMEGNLNVESEKGKGSVFSFELNFKVGERNKVIVSRKKQSDFAKTKTDARIILVEDDRVNQTVISRMLKEMGYTSDIADCGRDALKLFEDNSYDLCLLDIQMPGLDGIQTAGLIRQNEQNRGQKHIPIVAITAHALHGDRERFLSMGMDDYIAKPFQMSELFKVIEKSLEHASDNVSAYEVPLNSKPVDITEVDKYIMSCVHEIKPVIDEISRAIYKLKLMLKDGTFPEIEEVAHDIKSLASSISADKIKNHAFRIELAVRRGNQLEADRLCKELEEIFTKYSKIINEKEELA